MLTLSGAKVRGAAALTLPGKLPFGAEDLPKGIPLALPADTVFPFAPDFPEGRKLPDAVVNPHFMFPVSSRLREILAAEQEIEFLPILIADHKKKVVARDYVLANPLNPVDCVDLAKSDVVMNPLLPDKVDRFKSMVLVPGKIPKKRQAFRLASRTSTVVVTDAIAQAIVAAKVTGIECIPVEKYSSTGKIGV